MFSSVLAICGVLFIGVSSTLVPSYFNFAKLDYSPSLYEAIMDIFTESPNTTTLQAIGLISDNLNEFNLPLKCLHEDETPVIMGLDEPVFVHSSFIEINCPQGETGEILDEILPHVTASYTVIVILKNLQDLFFREIEACMLKVFEKCWEKPIANVAIMFPNNYKTSFESSSRPLKIFTYVYEHYNKEPLKNVTGMSFRKIFYNKAANLHLHPLKVLAHEKNRFFVDTKDDSLQSAGIDGSLTEILDQIFNATVILAYQITEISEAQEMVLHQRLELLKNGSIDIWMNARIIYPEIYEGITHTYPGERMDIICILPKNRDGHVKYKSIGGGRSLRLLLFMIPVFSSVILFVFLTNKILLQNMPLMKLAKVLLNQSDTVVAKTSSTTIRVLFGTWLLASLVFSTSMQTIITSRIIRPTVEDRMTTIQDIIESDIRLRIEQRFWESTKNHYSEEISRGLLGNIDVVSHDDFLKVHGPDIGYLSTKDTIEYINGEKVRVYALPETFLPNLAAYYLPEKSPFIPRFDKALMAITEAGITQKWRASNEHRYRLSLPSVEAVNPVKYIQYKHLKSAIYIYGIGMFLAVVVFICEKKFH